MLAYLVLPPIREYMLRRVNAATVAESESSAGRVL